MGLIDKLAWPKILFKKGPARQRLTLYTIVAMLSIPAMGMMQAPSVVLKRACYA